MKFNKDRKKIFMRAVLSIFNIFFTSWLLVGCAHVAQEGRLSDGRYCFRISKKLTCTAAPVPSDDQEVKAKKFITLPEQQIVWVVRNAWLDPYGKVTVDVEGAQVDMLPNTVSRLVLAPGRYQIIARHRSHKIDKFCVDGKSGQQTFVDVFADVGAFTTRYSLREISQEEGQAKVMRSKLISDIDIHSTP
jgi:hypothetical protein